MNDPSVSVDARADAAGVTPCQQCGSTAAIVELDAGRQVSIRRICCGGDPWWRSAAGRTWFAGRGVDVAAVAEARRHG